MADTDPTQMFQSGTLAMTYECSYNAATFYADPELRAKVDVAPMPRGLHRATVLHGLANVVYARTPHPELAKEFVQFLGSEQASLLQGKYGTAIPARNGTAEPWAAGMPKFDLEVHWTLSITRCSTPRRPTPLPGSTRIRCGSPRRGAGPRA